MAKVWLVTGCPGSCNEHSLSFNEPSWQEK